MCALQSSNGRRAWDVLCDNPEIAMLITDMQMPDMDGRQLIHQVRGSSTFQALPIVIVSGVVGVSEIAALLEQGASRFLSKPINVQHLKDYIETLLRGPQRAGASHASGATQH